MVCKSFPNVRIYISFVHSVLFSSEVTSGCLTGRDRGNSHPHVEADHTGTSEAESVISQYKSQRVVGRVRFPSSDEELEMVSESERRRVQPLLGYDWIAGKMEGKSYGLFSIRIKLDE
ncbi:uncharacterized protein LOC113657187 isoform X1 [Tachysurus ichikawai]